MAVSFNDAYKKWRNKARQYSTISLLDCAMQSLHHFSEGDRLTYVKSAPWLTALIIKWVCEDRLMNSRRSATKDDLDELRQIIWDLPEVIGSSIPADGNGRLFMRQLIRPQIGFQKSIGLAFLRTPLLLAELSETHSLRSLFRLSFGMEPMAFAELAYLLQATLLTGRRAVSATYFSSIESGFEPGEVEKFFKLISRDVDGLITYFRASAPGSRRTSELYEFPSLSRYPLLLVSGRYLCWDNNLLFRSFDVLVHRVLMEHGQKYSDPFGDVFEKHVLRVCRDAGFAIETEEELRKKLPAHSKVPDGLILVDGNSVYLEAKAGVFAEPVMTAATKEILYHKTKAISHALVQASHAAARLSMDDISKNFVLVVTNVELCLGSGDRFDSMLPEDKLATLGFRGDAIPLEHCYIVSIEDFERLMAGVTCDEVELVSFLRRCVLADREPHSSRLLMEQHLDRENVRKRSSRLIDDGRRKIEQRIESLLSE